MPNVSLSVCRAAFSVPITVPLTVSVAASVCLLLSRLLPVAFSDTDSVRVAPGLSFAVADPTVTFWSLWRTVWVLVNSSVIVQLPVAWREQVTGALTDVAPCLSVPTNVSVILPSVWEGTASKPLVAAILAPSPAIVTWQLR